MKYQVHTQVRKQIQPDLAVVIETSQVEDKWVWQREGDSSLYMKRQTKEKWVRNQENNRHMTTAYLHLLKSWILLCRSPTVISGLEGVGTRLWNVRKQIKHLDIKKNSLVNNAFTGLSWLRSQMKDKKVMAVMGPKPSTLTKSMAGCTTMGNTQDILIDEQTSREKRGEKVGMRGMMKRECKCTSFFKNSCRSGVQWKLV